MAEFLQWAFMALVSVMMPLVIWCLNHVAGLSKSLTDFKIHVAESYVQKPEIVKMGSDVAEIRRDITEILKTLHQIKGSQDTNGRAQ